MIKNPPASAGDEFDLWIRKSPEGGNGNYSSILAWKIPWTEEYGGLQSKGWQRVRRNSS